jgi:hypothetical protein
LFIVSSITLVDLLAGVSKLTIAIGALPIFFNGFQKAHAQVKAYKKGMNKIAINFISLFNEEEK